MCTSYVNHLVNRMLIIHKHTTASCSELSNPTNGIVLWTGLTTGSNAIYTCNSGYQWIGERIRTCMSNGVWSGQEPNCIHKKNAFVMCTHLYKLGTNRFAP